MHAMTEEMRLPADVDAQPLVTAAAALQPVIRKFHDEIERGQRMPPALFGQLREAGFYKMVIPRSLGGLQVDPLTYLRVVETLAEGAGSVGWNLGNGGVGQLVTLGLPDDGVDEIYGKRASPALRCPAAGGRCRHRAAIGSADAGSSAAAVTRLAGCWGVSR
jgi:indole-3-acetate monooxygenase